MLLVFLLLFFSAASCLQISVDPVNGNNSGCLDGSHPCLNITTALTVRQNNVQYLLYQGNHYLDGNVSDFLNLNNIYLGNASANARVLCLDSSAGLGFINVSNVTIQGTTFVGCGRIRNSATCDPMLFNYDSTTCTLAEIRVALYFYQSRNVMFYSMGVQDSLNAVGLLLYDTVGTNVIANSSFLANGALGNLNGSFIVLGGGGVHIEFSYCAPWPNGTCDIRSPLSIDFVSGSSYSILGCSFRYNRAKTVVNSDSTFIRPSKGYQTGLGCGGGLSVLFYGFAFNNNITISDCLFQNNTAVVGGGLALEYRDFVAGNSVLLRRNEFASNGELLETNGGGLSIVHTVSNTSLVGSNSIIISQCSYVNNSAFIGGAMSITVAPSSFVRPYYLISDCVFWQNAAKMVGAAISAFLQLFHSNSVAPVIKFSGKNTVAYNTIVDSNGVFEFGIGTVYTRGIPMIFDNQIIFQGNTGTALVSQGTYLDFCICNASFISNQGIRGGAMALLANSYIFLCNISTLKFSDNSAAIRGGAIYNEYIQETDAGCFMQYQDPYRLPSQWNAHFIFINNKAVFNGPTIYSSTLLPCSDSKPQTTFCWDKEHWDFNGADCTSVIASGPGNITMNSPARAYPGQIFKLSLVVVDELQHDVLNDTIFAAAVADSNVSVADVSDGFAYVSNGFIQVYSSSPRGNITLELNEVGSLGWHLDVNLELLDCPPGLRRAPAESNTELNGSVACICSSNEEEMYGSAVLCSSDSNGNSAAFLKLNYWMGYYPGTKTLVVGSCAPGYCSGSLSSIVQDQYIKLPLTAEELDGVICTKGRTGVLCGQCTSGYAVAVNSPTYECVHCDASLVSYNAVWYVFLSFLSLITVPVLIIIVGNGVTNGYANGIILFFQLAASTFDITGYGEININSIFPSHGSNLIKAYKVFYGLFNLNGWLFASDSFCIGTSVSVLVAIGMKFTASLLPLLVVIPIACCGCRCCNKRTCNFFVEKCKFKKNRHPCQIIAAFILLSFNNIVITTSDLITAQSLKGSDGIRVQQFRSLYAGNFEAMLPTLPLFIIPVLFPIVLLLCGCKHGMWWCKCKIRGYIKLLKQKLEIKDQPQRLGEHHCCGCTKSLKKKLERQSYCTPDPCGMLSDAFYACYKPKAQWFSAAYFFLRVAVSAAYILAEPPAFIFTVQQISCIVTFFVLAIIQPYKEIMLNVLDLIILGCLTILCTLSQYNLDVYGLNYQEIWVKICFGLQFAILFFLPIVWIIMICLTRTYCLRLGSLPVTSHRNRYSQIKEAYSRIPDSEDCGSVHLQFGSQPQKNYESTQDI